MADAVVIDNRKANPAVRHWEFTTSWPCVGCDGKGLALDGEMWPSVEHYFQASKFFQPEARRRVKDSQTPRDEAGSRDLAQLVRRDWDTVKFAIMCKANRAKFDQDPQLAALLLSTRGLGIVDGSDETGMNVLGRALSKIRKGIASVDVNPAGCRAVVLRAVLCTDPGDAAVVCGSSPELGCWDPGRAPRMRWIKQQRAGAHIWEMVLRLDGASDREPEYKFAIVNARGECLWQPASGANFKIFETSTWVHWTA